MDKAFEAESRALENGGLKPGGLRAGSLDDRPQRLERGREIEDKMNEVVGTDGTQMLWPFMIGGGGGPPVRRQEVQTPELEFTGCENGVETIFIIRARRA